MPIDLDLLIRAYSNGVFPMADARDDEHAYWVEPQKRAILPLDQFRLSRSLAKVIRQDRFDVTADTDFAGVIAHCAEETGGRRETWINRDIENAFAELHARGMAHSIECWSGGELVGGLYGLALGRAFFGESMFSRATDASKVALVWLVARLRLGGFELLDCQFMTKHLQSLGAIEISQRRYLELLADALDLPDQVSITASSMASGSGSSSGAGSARGSGLRDGAGASRCAGDWGLLDGLLGSPGSLAPASTSLADPEAGGFSTGASSPGKLILHSLTQMS
jgi:leucyl/phenylalanyl-tRNA---protein transferase